MKFEQRKEHRVEWKDGGVLIMNPPSMAGFIVESFPGETFEKASALEIGVAYVLASLVGWEGIEAGETGVALPINDNTKKEIAGAVMMDEAMQEKLGVVLKGPFENLAPGLNAQ